MSIRDPGGCAYSPLHQKHTHESRATKTFRSNRPGSTGVVIGWQSSTESSTAAPTICASGFFSAAPIAPPGTRALRPDLGRQRTGPSRRQQRRRFRGAATRPSEVVKYVPCRSRLVVVGSGAFREDTCVGQAAAAPGTSAPRRLPSHWNSSG
jgi:hypothetical protein